jgi:predicted ATPase
MIEPFITELVVHRFRSLSAASLRFDNPTFLVGQNGSGKSNLVDVLAFLADAMESPLQAVFDRRGGIGVVRNRPATEGGPPDLGIRVGFGRIHEDFQGGHYAFAVQALPRHAFRVVREQCLVCAHGKRYWFDRQGDSFTANVNGFAPALEPSALGLPLIGGQAQFAPVLRALATMRVYSIEPSRLREAQDPDAGLRLRRDGSNSASVLREIEQNSPAEMKRICQILESIVPSTNRVAVKDLGNKLALVLTQQWGNGQEVRFNAADMSDGTLLAVGLLSAIYQRPAPTLLVIEEPEAMIHAGAIGAVLDLLRHAARTMQVVVTTHSPELLDGEWIEGKHLRIVDWRHGVTRLAGASEATRTALSEHLMGAGELLRANALEAAPSSDEPDDPASLFDVLEDPR